MITNVGLALGGMTPQEPSLIRGLKQKPVADQAKENAIRQQLVQALPEKSEKLLPETPSAREIKRYGEAPSAIERSVDTGINTVGLRNPIIPIQPEPNPPLTEKVIEKHEDRVAALSTEALGDPEKQFRSSPSEVIERDSHPQTFEAYRRAVEEPERGTILNETA